MVVVGMYGDWLRMVCLLSVKGRETVPEVRDVCTNHPRPRDLHQETQERKEEMNTKPLLERLKELDASMPINKGDGNFSAHAGSLRTNSTRISDIISLRNALPEIISLLEEAEDIIRYPDSVNSSAGDEWLERLNGTKEEE